MNSSQYNKVKPFLPQQKFPRLDTLISSFKSHGMKDDTLNLYQHVASICTNDSREDVLLAIDELKKPLLQAKQRDHETYRMLKILEYVVEGLEGFDDHESESTSYRRFATIMDCLFRGTQVKCVDGEFTSDATKAIRMYNEAILNITSADAKGKKIDLLIKYASSQGVEISSNEFKAPHPTPSVALQQQCKNLRSNAAIFNYIRSLDPRKPFTHVAAMDWLGSVGYLYLIPHDGH
ncbi:hypothetical protein EC973_007522 [Apophysomyces ossiformis]|uniref:Uncharacterized protein n=1 Tax=Apophysomyces ossiformis TaxID=679940 RepID=A0A8H7EU58_9FUNG|nr:hypothetical protein EC973_007522 [Apophysomyces ossiformis]